MNQIFGNLYTQSIPIDGESLLIEGYLHYGSLDLLFQNCFCVAPTLYEIEQAKFLLFKNRLHPACYIKLTEILGTEVYSTEEFPDVEIPRIDYQLYSSYGVKVRSLAKAVGISSESLFSERLPYLTRLEHVLIHLCIKNAYMPRHLLGFWCSYLDLDPSEFTYIRNIQRLLEKYHLKRTEKLEDDRQRIMTAQSRIAIGFHTNEVEVIL